MSKTNVDLAKKARELVARGGTYQERDCQGFVEKCFHEIGIKCNYRGSNDMIRNLAVDVKKIDENIKIGDLVFWVRTNGKEPERYKRGGNGWREDMDGWNASHVGIYLGNGEVAESAISIGKWAITDIKQRKATHYGKAKTIVYENNIENAKEDIKEYAIVVTANAGKLNIRQLPSKSSKAVARLDFGQIIKIQGQGNWGKAYNLQDTFIGYCMLEFLRMLDKETTERIKKIMENKNA